MSDDKLVKIRDYSGTTIYYAPMSERFVAKVPDGPELHAESETDLRKRLDRSIAAYRSKARPAVEAILVRFDHPPIVGVFRGFHARTGALLFHNVDGKAVEVEKYGQTPKLVPPSANPAQVKALATTIVWTPRRGCSPRS
ncbi:MAG TPA: hypothetical protein VIW28_00525 [Gemmatimonadales bacterium]|jgi:hypothetical protein